MITDIHGELRHFCWDWDGLLIDESCQEIASCSCVFSSYTEEEKQDIIAEASKTCISHVSNSLFSVEW